MIVISLDQVSGCDILELFNCGQYPVTNHFNNLRRKRGIHLLQRQYNLIFFFFSTLSLGRETHDFYFIFLTKDRHMI